MIAWAKKRGLFVHVDRATPWGNPFVPGRDGDRATVVARYRDDYLPSRPGLLARLGELRGKALGCWCAPAPCHADVLIREMERLGSPAECAAKGWAASHSPIWCRPAPRSS